jgi:hypothetical protein
MQDLNILGEGKEVTTAVATVHTRHVAEGT